MSDDGIWNLVGNWMAVPAPDIINGHELNLPERIVLAIYAHRWRHGEDVIVMPVAVVQSLTGYSYKKVRATLAQLEQVGALEPVLCEGKHRVDLPQYRIGAAVLSGADSAWTGNHDQS